MSDRPDQPEDGDSTSGEAAVPEPGLLRADEVHLSDPDVSADSVEPVLGTSAEEVRLSEPSLGTAEISEEAAEAAALDEVAAEAESVAQEAENVGTLVAGPRAAEDPAEAAEPSGTAPAGGKAGDVAEAGDVADADDLTGTGGEKARDGEPEAAGEKARDGEPEAGEEDADGPAGQVDTSGTDAGPSGLPSFAASGEDPAWTGRHQDQSRWDNLFEAGQATADAGEAGAYGNPAAPSGGSPVAPDAPWAQPFAGPQPQAPGSPVAPVGGPYGLPPAGSGDAGPTRVRARSRSAGSVRGSSRKKLVVLAAIGLVVAGLLLFAVISIVNALQADDPGAGSSPSTTAGADGILAEDISPLQLETGACIRSFDSANVSADVTTVTCTTPHNAQLLATTSLPEDAEFPGEVALNARGEDLCNSVAIDENAAANYGGLTLTQVTPTSGTWEEGDRRIDCFVVSDEGNIITDTLLAE